MANEVKAPDPSRYEEWLTTIANTRLIYNKMSELEETLGHRSIRKNGIKRSLGRLPRIRAAYRDRFRRGCHDCHRDTS